MAGAADRAAAPKKKKITRLVPPEEELAPIEELTERSEDSSLISESLVSPYRPSGRPPKIKDSTIAQSESLLEKVIKHKADRKKEKEEDQGVQSGNAMIADQVGSSRDVAPKPPPSRSKEQTPPSEPHAPVAETSAPEPEPVIALIGEKMESTDAVVATDATEATAVPDSKNSGESSGINSTTSAVSEASGIASANATREAKPESSTKSPPKPGTSGPSSSGSSGKSHSRSTPHRNSSGDGSHKTGAPPRTSSGEGGKTHRRRSLEHNKHVDGGAMAESGTPATSESEKTNRRRSLEHNKPMDSGSTAESGTAAAVVGDTGASTAAAANGQSPQPTPSPPSVEPPTETSAKANDENSSDDTAPTNGISTATTEDINNKEEGDHASPASVHSEDEPSAALDSLDAHNSLKEMEVSKADFSLDQSLLEDSTRLHGSAHSGSNQSEMFDFDDDEDQGDDEDKEEHLTWRLDPSLSLSDWAIIIRNKKDGTKESYHVHKNMLAVGPRKCEYFVKTFRNMAKISSENKTAWPISCELELEEVGAKVFPSFLDFVYSPEGTLKLKTEDAPGLRYLSNFFGIRSLHKRVMDFIQKDLSLATMAVYYKELHSLQDEKLLATAAKYCAKNILKIEPSYAPLKLFDPTFFLLIMQSEHIDSKQRRHHVSLLLAEYCRLKKGKLNASEFAKLTDEKELPTVHYSAALTFLEVESDIVVATSLKNMMEMSSLQKRCVRDLSTHWKELCDMDEANVTKVCRKLPCSVVAELMMKSLSNAKRKTNADLAEAAADSTKQRKGKKPLEPAVKLKKEYEAKVEELKQHYEEQLEKLKKEAEAKVYMARQMIAQKDKHISFQLQELRNFERLPNSYDGKLAPTGRSHEATLLPEFSQDKAEGMLLVSKKNGPKYPLYFYKRDEPDLSVASETSRKEQKPP